MFLQMGIGFIILFKARRGLLLIIQSLPISFDISINHLTAVESATGTAGVVEG